jgi:hypothetical protein
VCENTLLPLPDAGANHNAIIPQVPNLVIIDVHRHLDFNYPSINHIEVKARISCIFRMSQMTKEIFCVSVADLDP